MSRRARISLVIIAVLVAVLTLAGALQAAPGVTTRQVANSVPGAAGPMGKPRIVNGVVVEVKTTAPLSVTLRLGWHGGPEVTPQAEPSPAASKTFPVADQASVLVNGQPAVLGDVEPGYRAALVLDAQGNAVTVVAWSAERPETITVRGWLVRLPALPGQTTEPAVQYFGLVPVGGPLPGKGPVPGLPPGFEPAPGAGQTSGAGQAPGVAGGARGHKAGVAASGRPLNPLHVVLLLPKDAAAQAEMQALLGQLVAVHGQWVESPTPIFGRALQAGNLDSLPWPPVPPVPKGQAGTT